MPKPPRKRVSGQLLPQRRPLHYRIPKIRPVMVVERIRDRAPASPTVTVLLDAVQAVKAMRAAEDAARPQLPPVTE
jgi:hypothetical protein